MASLNNYYLDLIAFPSARRMVNVHRGLHGGRVDQLPNVTCAAIAWLITGVDAAAPFSSAWLGERAKKGTGPEGVDRMIAYCGEITYTEDGEEFFDDESTILMLHRNGKTLLIDSDYINGRGISVREVEAAPPPHPGGSARYVCLTPLAEQPLPRVSWR
jgi:hypothetical protein